MRLVASARHAWVWLTRHTKILVNNSRFNPSRDSRNTVKILSSIRMNFTPVRGALRRNRGYVCLSCLLRSSRLPLWQQSSRRSTSNAADLDTRPSKRADNFIHRDAIEQEKDRKAVDPQLDIKALSTGTSNDGKLGTHRSSVPSIATRGESPHIIDLGGPASVTEASGAHEEITQHESKKKDPKAPKGTSKISGQVKKRGKAARRERARKKKELRKHRTITSAKPLDEGGVVIRVIYTYCGGRTSLMVLYRSYRVIQSLKSRNSPAV